jgi:hypothetical protein
LISSLNWAFLMPHTKHLPLLSPAYPTPHWSTICQLLPVRPRSAKSLPVTPSFLIYAFFVIFWQSELSKQGNNDRPCSELEVSAIACALPAILGRLLFNSGTRRLGACPLRGAYVPVPEKFVLFQYRPLGKQFLPAFSQ